MHDLLEDDFDQADKMYKQLFRSEEPTLASELMEHAIECGMVKPLELFEELFGVPYDPTLLMYELCNYKGEGDGEYAVGEEALKLPIFISKRQSYDMFL